MDEAHDLISDSMRAYADGIEQVFGMDARHIQSKGLTGKVNTNLIERFHSTHKQRYKVMRGLMSPDNAQTILDRIRCPLQLLQAAYDAARHYHS